MNSNSLGVAIVSYCSGDVILDCLDSLLASTHQDLKIVVCDNASPDDTVELIQKWARSNKVDFGEIGMTAKTTALSAKVTLVHNTQNKGYAGGVNACLDLLKKDPEVSLYWVLNPDCVVEPKTAEYFSSYAETSEPFSMMGCRILYHTKDPIIQSDGGTVNPYTGVCSNINMRQKADTAVRPDVTELDFISGANFVASDQFLEQAGLMTEDYFLYYEEVEWAQRRGALPLAWCDDAVVLHHAGTSIGSGSHTNAPTGFSNYFNFRNRMWFIKTHNPMNYPIAYLYSFAKIIKILIKDGRSQAHGAWLGLNNFAPSNDIEARIAPDARKYAFKKRIS